ncbi:CarD family transcriptional regulator [Cryobacterium sp. TMT1-21]|uniref:CarD family transcriptional regulator n=1 Tax=Cryobacterium shii TaxID=1259235 RepID=A0AAQ2HEI6_9MICO|nr:MULTISPECIES: CarD family transcriptional regulator [Cryobacterium]TFC42015.1 CarD family transcriptional regulator [Cryobacterium shii]TFC81934.1 CarD family transcriptional regulator [Cryobacterium sp. TmT2-59]TFD09576.1 CarD family transcriptional regulator [Cryobacterium sp. TMT1-21]TFD18385.1 CarD family transcriptional regulator [Cryobacterium sp. TMT2-23]TFD18407.1 CarD family transcriptional regulator [Cryobacterium sp. TMT4-10]
MKFIVGETLVYPHHGAVTLTELSTITLKGVEQPAMTLRVHSSQLTIQLPIANAALVGVRDVIDAAGLEEVYKVLRDPFTEEATNWSRRFKANQEKMASDSVTRVAEVVRDLWRREQDGGVSAGEKRMLAKSRQLLESELALALGTSPEDTVVALNEVLSGALTEVA